MDRIRIYAKSADSKGERETLSEHTINDLKAARRLVQNLPFGPVKKRYIRKLLDLIIAFHDVGKGATGFQKSLEKGAKHWGHRHEIASAAAALGVIDLVVFVIITHHKQIFPDETHLYGLPENQVPFENKQDPIWLEMAAQFDTNIVAIREEVSEILKFIGREDLLLDKQLSLSVLSENMGKWLRRDKQPKEKYMQRYYASLLRGLTMSADHLMSAGDFIPPRIPRLVDYNLSPPKPYGFQLRAAKAKGNLILRAPTGSGKTEAALMWAQQNQQHNGRMFYTLPTTASINAMYLRLINFFGEDIVGLLHSRNISSLYSMLESRSNGQENALFNQQEAKTLASLVREMYFPIRVCTPHQVLRYTLQGKGWEAMLSEFPHSVFVFDEVHAYNPKLTGLTMATVRYLTQHKARCMFLTATLPTFIKNLIEQQLPGIEFIQPSYDNESDRRILEQKRHIVEPVDGNILDNIDLIAAKSQSSISNLVVCNHIRTAQQVYTELAKQVEDVTLLHSQYTRHDRIEIENSLRERLPKILVSTQLVEVSLDLDFEQCFTEAAPIDALVQRMGRVNRKAAQPQPAKVHIFKEQYSDASKPYTQAIRDKSLEVLTGLPMPLSEEDLNAVADKVYGNGYEGDELIEYEEGLNYEHLKEFKRDLIAGTNEEDWIEQVIDPKECTVELLPEPLVSKYYDLKEQKQTIEANDLIVPVSKWILAKLLTI